MNYLIGRATLEVPHIRRKAGRQFRRESQLNSLLHSNLAYVHGLDTQLRWLEGESGGAHMAALSFFLTFFADGSIPPL